MRIIPKENRVIAHTRVAQGNMNGMNELRYLYDVFKE
jgi:hypothetical protein